MANYWKEEYLSKLRSAEEAVREIREGDTVILGHCIAEPKALVDAMVANAQQYHDVAVSYTHLRSPCGSTPPGPAGCTQRPPERRSEYADGHVGS